MDAFKRRQFISVSAGMFGANAVGQAQVVRRRSRRVSPNETIGVAVVGVGGRGGSHVSAFMSKPGGESPTEKGTRIATICDVDTAMAKSAMMSVEKNQGKAPKFETDLRRIMDDPEVDVVSIATTNHWHALATILACQAGKDVYVEKPISHNIFEGRKAVEAARKYGRIVQGGTQSRSSEALHEAVEYLRSGKLGKLYMAKGLCFKPRGSIGKVTMDQQPPATINYDIWIGPAPMKPVRRQKFHYDWHWLWDYGNGDLGNQGVHQMDLARWFLGKKELPKTVMSSGGRLGYVDDGETPNTQMCVFEYDDVLLQFEVRGLVTNDEAGAKIGVIVYGSEGYMVVPNYSAWTAFNPGGKEVAKGSKGGDHFANFIKAVRSRNVSDLNADIEEGHQSAALCHLANISYRLGRKLKIDPKTEKFLSDTEANKMLTRDYRKPYVVPDRV